MFDVGLKACLQRLCSDWTSEKVDYSTWIISSSLNHLSALARLGVEREELEAIVTSIIDNVVGDRSLANA